MTPDISVVVPMHNEEGNVVPLYEELKPVLDRLGRTYEILFVDDGSTDRTLDRMLTITDKDAAFAAVELDGNFGEAGALSAGFGVARGRVVVTMDGDLQNDPRDIPRLLEKIEAGWSVVSGRRRNRKEPFFSRRLPSVAANWLIARVTGVDVHDTGCSLKAYRREVVAGKNIPRGFQRFVPAVFGVRGSEVTEIFTEDRDRRFGSTHYGLSRTVEVLRDLAAIRLINRNPRLYARVMPVLCAAGAIVAACGIVFPLGPELRWVMGIAGALAASFCALAAYGIRRYLKAQVRKTYRIRAVHCGGTDD
jgi:glycosyltransferase involved in cell wall biosynthesis